MVVTKNEFILALNQLSNERGIPPEEIIHSIEAAVLAAYRKEYPQNFDTDVVAKIDQKTGETRIYKNNTDITPPGFGRIGAQTAKQVIIQKLREAEKKQISNLYQSMVGGIIRGRIIRYDGKNVFFDIGKAEAIMQKEEQIKNEKYQLNQNLSLYLKKIESDKFGNSRIIVSRSDPNFLIELLKKEIPEVANKTVEIVGVAREPGERAKIAVTSKQKGVDPVGACVGQKGIRIQTITDQLGGQEKIDVIQWHEDNHIFITNALSPAKVERVELDEKQKKAKVYLTESQAALAIGKAGVNVNLASKLTGYTIDLIQLKEEKKDNIQTNNINQAAS
jgi:N utilization substance protein A